MSVMAPARHQPSLLRSHCHPFAGQLQKVIAKLLIILTKVC